MKFGKCRDCKKVTFLTRHSEKGGHRKGRGWIYVCRTCHDKIHGIIVKRKSRSKRGSDGKLVKGTRRKK